MIYTGRGSTALWAVLQALQMPGGRILVPVNVCEIVVAVILKAGWRPVFCDVNPVTGNAGTDEFDAAWSTGIDCVLAVSNFGTPLPMDAVRAWAASKRTTLIEDVCNALGATHAGQAIGTFGDAAIYSFGYGKIIEHRTGGGLTVQEPGLRARVQTIVDAMPVYAERHRETDRVYQERLRAIRASASQQTPDVYGPLYDRYADDLWYRIDAEDIVPIEAARHRLADNLARRRQIGAIYEEGIRHPAVRLRPRVDGDVFWRFTFTVARSRRQPLLDAVRAEGLLASTWYPPVAQLFVSGAATSEFPGAEEFGATVVNLFTDYRVDHAAAARAVTVINRLA